MVKKSMGPDMLRKKATTTIIEDKRVRGPAANRQRNCTAPRQTVAPATKPEQPVGRIFRFAVTLSAKQDGNAHVENSIQRQSRTLTLCVQGGQSTRNSRKGNSQSDQKDRSPFSASSMRHLSRVSNGFEQDLAHRIHVAGVRKIQTGRLLDAPSHIPSTTG